MLSKNKKSVDVPLRKSDRRALRHVAGELFPKSPQQVLDAVFLEGTLFQRKIVLPKLGKTLLYFRSPSPHDESLWPYRTTTQCIWISADSGPNHIIHAPTVALLSILPDDFPTVEIPSQVSKFLCRGAHLMRAGMRSIPSPRNNNIVAIRVNGNPLPLAVGRMTENITSSTIGADAKGVGVEVWTCYGDDLWRQALAGKSANGIISPLGGVCYDNGHFGNAGFLEGKVVIPIIALEDSNVDNKGEEPDDSSPNVSCSASQTAHDSTPSLQPQNANDTQPEDPLNEPTNNVYDDGDTDNNANAQHGNCHDEILHQAVCSALVNIKDSELPMTTANFYAQHVIPHRALGSTIELKLTTWKKFGVYLKHQVDRGLLTVQAHDTNPMGYLVGIERKHEDLRGYKKKKMASLQTTKLQVVNLCIIPHHFVSKLQLDPDAVKAVTAKVEQRRGTGMLTIPEARTILEQYLTDNELLNVSSQQVRLDGALTDVLYKKQDAPESLSRKDLFEKWMDKMEPAFCLVEMPANHIRKLGRGMPPKVSMEVSLRQGRKFITKLRGLEEFGICPVAFTKDVSRRFACSGTVETNHHRKEHVELVFQGYWVEELRALLLGDERLTSHGGAKNSDYCLPKTVIDVVLKKGVPAKKPK